MPLKGRHASAIYLRSYGNTSANMSEKDKRHLRVADPVVSTTSMESDSYQKMILEYLVPFSYLVWTIVSAFCLVNYGLKYGNDLLRFGNIAFVITTSNAALGLTEFYDENVMYSLRILLEFLQLTVAIPCFTTEIWLKHGVGQKEAAYAHVVVGLLPTYIFLLQHYTRNDLVDFTVLMCVVSLFGVGVKYENYFAIATGIVTLLAHCVLNHRHEISREMPSRQIFNYAMSVCTYCAFKAIM